MSDALEARTLVSVIETLRAVRFGVFNVSALDVVIERLTLALETPFTAPDPEPRLPEIEIDDDLRL